MHKYPSMSEPSNEVPRVRFRPFLRTDIGVVVWGITLQIPPSLVLGAWSWMYDSVRQLAETFDFDGDGIAGIDDKRSVGTGEHDVTRFKSEYA